MEREMEGWSRPLCVNNGCVHTFQKTFRRLDKEQHVDSGRPGVECRWGVIGVNVRERG